MKCERVGHDLMAKSLMESMAGTSFRPKWAVSRRTHLFSSVIRASQPMDCGNSKVYKELGLFSLKKKIEDAINRVELLAPTALESEKTRQVKHEEVLREYNLWDDLSRSNESLTALADCIKVINDLKDLQHKAEEAKLITQLAEMDIINHQLFKQAYNTSVDVSKFLDHYEMSRLLNGPYDKEGACVIIRAGPEGLNSEFWADKILSMYMRWAEKHGYKGRVIEKHPSKVKGIQDATIEFESEYVYGYLCGEKGTHKMVDSSLDGSFVHETCSASVDVIPLFMEKPIDLQINDKYLEISSSSSLHEVERAGYGTELAVSIHHIPSGTIVQSSGERSHFANKTKALDRLKAKLLVLAMEQGLTEIRGINPELILDAEKRETRRYVFRPHKAVHDVRTGFQLSDLNSVLDGDIDPLIRAHVSLRHERDMG